MIPTGNGSWNFITERIFKCCLQSGKGLVKVLRTGRNLIFFLSGASLNIHEN